MKRQILLILPVLLLIAGILGLTCISIQADPMVLLQPQDARVCAQRFLDAVSAGDLTAAEQYLYGSTGLRTPEGSTESAAALWRASYQGFSYTFSGSMNAAGMAVEIPVTVTCAPIDDLLEALSQTDAPITSEAALLEAIGGLTQNLPTRTIQITLRLIREDGRWQIIPEQPLLNLITGQVSA